ACLVRLRSVVVGVVMHRQGLCAVVVFFFSSRRRHTGFSRDWSSDVCSSDLQGDSTEGTEEPEEAAESLRGSIRGPDRQPIPGLTIRVTQDDAEIGTATTDDNGQWEVPLPGPGTYSVSLDPAELPEGVAPRAEGGETVTGVVVRPGANQGVIFQLAAGDSEGGGGSTG